MKTTISIPNDVFQQVQAAAKRLRVSRSEVFTRAVQHFLLIASDAEIKASYDAAFGDAADASDVDGFRREATRKALLAVEWHAAPSEARRSHGP